MQNFINDLLELFDEKPSCEINGETIFKDIPGWDSLVALSLIVMISNNYRKSIDGEVIRNSHTIRELYDALND
jgi:acyl carrier protein